MKLKNKPLEYTARAAAVLTLLASFAAQAVDTFDASTQLLTLDAVTLGGTTYNNVRATVSAYTLLGVDGGTPVADTFDAGTNLLTLGAVTFQGATYNNVRVRINTYTLLSVGSSTPGAGAVYANLSGASLGAGASLNGAIPFPANNAWNTDISGAPVDANSDALIASIGLTRGLHPDFGSGLYEGAPIGIPYVVVSSTQPKVAVTFTDYGDESDPGPYPIPADAPIEGQLANGGSFGGDRHVLVIDRDANRLYETGNSYPQAGGAWRASGGAVFHTDSNTVRPGGQPGWTSADAAGLPIFPGLARYDEASTGVIRHALRFTASTTRRAYVPPATHWASSNTSANVPPMGMRVRLKASYVIPASFSTESKAILQSMKTYGMLLADNGSNWYVSGAPDPRWNNDKLVSELGSVKGSSFEVVRMDGLVTP
ncbi:hypothetical protein [Rhodoferax sp. AJA081-3]|uniref:hypothetical protein n=1 Tax=Rhodoferax sp. AJA081-3 TaxID=2752316 RepID=UPI001FD83909|nr:hypothetical protein [Rhodoferax sp. AJA081-3]